MCKHFSFVLLNNVYSCLPKQAREIDDPPGLLEKTEYLLREWVNIYHSREAYKYRYEDEFRMFVGLLNRHGILKTDDMITKFIKMSTQMCVDLCYAALAEQNNAPTLVSQRLISGPVTNSILFC